MRICPTSGKETTLNSEAAIQITYTTADNHLRTFTAFLLEDEFIPEGQQPTLTDIPGMADITLKGPSDCKGQDHFFHFMVPYHIPRRADFYHACDWSFEDPFSCLSSFDLEGFEKVVIQEAFFRGVHGIENLQVGTTVLINQKESSTFEPFTFIFADKGEREATEEELIQAQRDLEIAKNNQEEERKLEIVKEYDRRHPQIIDPKPDPESHFVFSLGGTLGKRTETNRSFGGRIALTHVANETCYFLAEDPLEKGSPFCKGTTLAYSRDQTHHNNQFELSIEKALIVSVLEGGVFFGFNNQPKGSHDKALGVLGALKIIFDIDPQVSDFWPYLRASGQLGYSWPSQPTRNADLIGHLEVGLSHFW